MKFDTCRRHGEQHGGSYEEQAATIKTRVLELE